jgi:cytochrome c biogenesis protein CcdA/thiol-disulfide isomerase/thioredoxin
VVVLLLIGFLGGLVTGISPCVLPVLPVIFAVGATSGLRVDTEAAGEGQDAYPRAAAVAVDVAVGVGSRGSALPSREDGASVPTVGPAGPDTRVADADSIEAPSISDAEARLAELRRRSRPIAVVGGLVLSFSVFTLTGSWLLSILGLPQDALRWIGLIVLGALGLGLIVPAIGEALEVPFARLGRGHQHTEGGGFVLGLSLGLVFVPCAGPVLAAITVVGAEHRFGLSALVLTVAFAMGVAVPLLVFALLGQRLAGHMQLVRTQAAVARRVAGVILLLTALSIGFNLTAGLQRALPGYTDALQKGIEANAGARQALGGVTGNGSGGVLANCTDGSPVLQQCGTAPPISGITQWLNTPDGRSLSIAGLRGRVVLVDFWTYSCINCQRSLPHVEAWNRAYAADGLTVIGVHTPEFAFEHVVSNVAVAARQLGVLYPVAIDNQYATWTAYENSYWPAEYLIDASGRVRHVDFGEGQYQQTESFIRQLLVAADPKVVLPRATDVADTMPTEQTTPESYLGYQHPQNLAGQTVQEDRMSTYQAPASIPQDEYAYNGEWSIGSESATAGQGAMLSLRYQARDVYLVLGGSGTIKVSVDGVQTRAIVVGGVPRLYQLVGSDSYQQRLLSLAVSPGVQAYDFTFG